MPEPEWRVVWNPDQPDVLMPQPNIRRAKTYDDRPRQALELVQSTELSPDGTKMEFALAGAELLSQGNSLADSAAVSATEMLHQIHSGEKTCAAFMGELLGRVDAANGTVNAIIEGGLAAREALMAAAAALRRKGALAISRGGKGDVGLHKAPLAISRGGTKVGLEQLEEHPDQRHRPLGRRDVIAVERIFNPTQLFVRVSFAPRMRLCEQAPRSPAKLVHLRL